MKILLILILCLGCAQRSGYYKQIDGKWTFVSKKAGFYNFVTTPRVYKSKLSIQELGMFIWPVPATRKISSFFGKRRGSHHDGIDIPSTTGSHILAAADGKVIFSGWMRGYGKIIVLKHDKKYNTVYAHNSKNFAKKGERVSRGSVIGKIGNTGRSTGPHLHFEIRKSNQVIDPMKFFEIKRSIASK